MNENSTDKFAFEYSGTAFSSINMSLERYGIVILKGFVEDELLKKCRLEFNSAVSEKLKGCIQLHKHPLNPGKVARYQFDLMDKSLGAIRELYSNELIGAVERNYYGNEVLIKSCDQIFFTHEVESEHDILPWHFDRQESLKFYINLDHVNEENGAFQYDPGSHRLGHMIANYCIALGEEIGKIPNDIPDSFLVNPMTIAVNAGDLVIFDAAGFHKAGCIKSGKQRRVIRAHSHPLPVVTYRARPLALDWFLSKVFAGLRPLSGKRFRRYSPRIIENLNLTRKT